MRDQLNAGATSETAQTWKTLYTRHTLSYSNKANINYDYGGQMIFRDLVGLKFPAFVSQVRKNPEKTSPKEPVPTGDRTRDECVTGAHATACSTAVDIFITSILKYMILLKSYATYFGPIRPSSGVESFEMSLPDCEEDDDVPFSVRDELEKSFNFSSELII